MRAIYIKPMTWAGKLSFYLGQQPSNPTADYCSRLGSYFIQVQTLSAARAIADSEAQRLGLPIVECPHYVGL